MTTVHILVGLPGSGKSTFSKKLREENPKTIVINKDAIRTMINGGTFTYDHDLEPIVKLMATELLYQAASEGYDVIVDECHIKKEKRLYPIADKKIAYVFEDSGNEELLTNRMKEHRNVAAAAWLTVINSMRQDFEPIDDDDEMEKIYDISKTGKMEERK